MTYKKYIKKTIISLLAIVFVVILSKEFLLSTYNPAINHLYYDQIINDIKTTQPLPDKFIFKLNETVNLSKANYLTINLSASSKTKWCPCEDLVHEMLFKTDIHHRILLNQKVMTMKYERSLTLEECLSFKLRDMEFSNGINGITAAAEYYFDKKLDNLNKVEAYALIMMTKNPRQFDLDRKPELMKEYYRMFSNKNSSSFLK